jgi:PAS domain S-box-containing protein
MPAAAILPNEAARLQALRALGVLDSAPDATLDELTRQATEVCQTPAGLVSLVDEKRQWFKSRHGIDHGETSREVSFCAHALLDPSKPLIVPDATLDPRFADNPDVTGGPHIRFYAGVPLRSPDGWALGTLCVFDYKPRQLSAEQIEKLRALARQVAVRLSLRRNAPAERRLWWSFGVSLALLFGMALFFAFQAARFLSSTYWVAQTRQVIEDVERTLSGMQAAESNQRGYTASGLDVYVPPFRTAVAAAASHLEALRRETIDNPVQQLNVTQLNLAIGAKLAVMQERFKQRRSLGIAALDPRYLDGTGRRLMADVAAACDRMTDEEKSLLRRRDAARTAGLRTAVAMLLGTSALGACLLGAGFLLIRGELRRTRALGGALAQANLGLEGEVAERRQAQRHLSTQHAVAHIAAENVSVPAAAPLFLRSICEHLDWELGQLWTVDPETNRMRLTSYWHTEAASPAEATLKAQFVAASQAWTFAKGEALPGRVWETGTALWEQDIQQRPSPERAHHGLPAGLHRAFAFPLRTSSRDDRVSGAMVFLSKEQDAPSGELIAAMDTLAGQIAQFAERCRAEAGLRASQARFTAFIENAPVLAYIKDAEGHMVYGNQTLRRTFNIRPEDWPGKTDADFWPGATPLIRENDRKVLAGRTALELNESLALPNGMMSHWLSYKFPLHDEATGRLLLAGMSIDITARQEAEDNRRAKLEAERANRAKSEFLSRVSHELRTPLNAILGFGQLLQVSALPAADAESTEYILKAARHLLALVDDVLDLSRADSGELQLAIDNVDVRTVSLESVHLMTRQMADCHLTCEVIGFENDPTAWCDEQRLRQILLNLVSNAIKYNREGGQVLVQCACLPGDRLRLSVRDTGRGLTPLEIKKLFVPFERLDQQNGKIKGIGLGLAVSRRMAEAMQGSLGVESELGRGSTFFVELPMGTSSAPPYTSSEAEAGVRSALVTS